MTLRSVGGLAILLAAMSTATAQAASSVAQLLKDGYEIKTAFADASGGAYIVLQRGISAYMCHCSPRQTCEKLN